MSPSTRATLLMFALLWQSLLWLTPLGQAQLSTDIANAWVHAQAATQHAAHPHDHQSDPSLHLDDHSLDGAHHHHHEAAQPLGLAPHSDGLGFDRPQSTPFAGQTAPIATVFLQGQLR
ncbi:hypothetical protein, partial [uncultured Limnohabitans sp.]|uniref:hypothetical protein n=1 Tax=uncultured Limnohabitans sp. TaxID=768543 RepID=UPI002604E831